MRVLTEPNHSISENEAPFHLQLLLIPNRPVDLLKEVWLGEVFHEAPTAEGAVGVAPIVFIMLRDTGRSRIWSSQVEGSFQLNESDVVLESTRTVVVFMPDDPPDFSSLFRAVFILEPPFARHDSPLLWVIGAVKAVGC